MPFAQADTSQNSFMSIEKSLGKGAILNYYYVFEFLDSGNIEYMKDLSIV